MSQAASQAAIFYRDVAKNKKLWTLKDEQGYPIPKSSNGLRAMPFWSSLSRVKLIIKNVSAYKNFQAEELSLEVFFDYWMPELKKENQAIGVNWSGSSAVGWDLNPDSVKRWIEYEIEKLKIDALEQ